MWAKDSVFVFCLIQNPLKLVSDIVKGDFEDIAPQYTEYMSTLVKLLLSQVK